MPPFPDQLFAGSPVVRVGTVTLVATNDPQTQREKLARIVLDSMYQFVGLLDADGIMLEINRAALEGAGIQLEEVRGKPFWEARWWAISEASRTQLRNLILRASRGEFVRQDFEVYGREAGREMITVDFSLLPVKDHNGKVVFLLPEGRDITEKKRAEAEVARKNKELQRLQAATEKARAVSEQLLLNILPSPIVERLRTRSDHPDASVSDIIADSFHEVSVLFADIVDFTKFSSGMSPEQLVALLNELFTEFDGITDAHGLEKIKTIGDTYMAAAGLPIPVADHATRTAGTALDMMDALARFNTCHHYRLQLRIGIHSGAVVAGVIGKRKFIYDLWGETVNTASRMESHGVAGKIQLTEATRNKLGGGFLLQERGAIDVKGMGELHTWFLTGRSLD
ncbi:adenylate/guanylate cyclase domain-containing protein [Marinobacterium aestuariivivens]|uniref:Adenylate/guanylate cyclase domain-containing protein n=1 Tax=Marinobacterium aestuariivivens TaxID=1698799 RepID=A0ABW2A5U0_9GAMM